jgi:hypothetical protein
MKTKLSLFTVLALLFATGQIIAQSTAFTYHGRLNDNGVPVNGPHDMQFSVYDSEVGGQLVAGPPPQNAIEVINGLFRARIDFGAGVFTGPARWLEIQVRPAGNGNFQTLSPRQELTSSPYSIRAQTAGTAADVSNGSVVKSLNTLKDDVTLVEGANVTIAPEGNTLKISSTGPGGSVWGLNGANAHYTAGNVGIGTTTPPAPLSVFSSTASALDNTAVFFAPAIGPAASHIHYGTSGDWFIRSAAANGKVVIQDSGGNVGIGSAATPNHRLRISDGPLWTSDSWRGALELDTASAIGWRANASGTHFGIGQSLFGLHIFATTSTPGTTGNPANYYMTVSNEGNVGIGTFPGNVKLDVAGDAAATRLILRADPGAPANAAVLCADPNVLNFVPYNTATARPLNLIVRDAVVRQLTITGGADLAEPFPMDAGMEKGSVVVIDPENPGRLKRSAQSYDKRVAGIVSGANGIDPGIALKQEGALDQGENVALTGRVYVLADASRDGIEPGDLLTTSDTPGHAMKVTDHAKAQGAILGKAMGRLKEGKGMVLVLVTLQ